MAKEYQFAQLLFEKDVLKKVYENPGFSYIVFQWKKLYGSDIYGLFGKTYKDDGEPTNLDFITLNEVKGKGVKLKSMVLGVLVLTKALMGEKDMDGSSDAFFKPRKYKDASGEKDYVSYDISEKSSGLAVKDFELNPSPPR